MTDNPLGFENNSANAHAIDVHRIRRSDSNQANEGGARVGGLLCGAGLAAGDLSTVGQCLTTETAPRNRKKIAVTAIAVTSVALNAQTLLASELSVMPSAVRSADELAATRCDPFDFSELAVIPGVAGIGPSFVGDIDIIVASSIEGIAGIDIADRLPSVRNIGPCPEQITKPKLPCGASASSMTTLDSRARDVSTVNTRNNMHREAKDPRDKKRRSGFMAVHFTEIYNPR